MNEDLLTTAEAAAMLGVTVTTVNRMASEGRLMVAMSAPGRHGARWYSRADIDALTATQ